MKAVKKRKTYAQLRRRNAVQAKRGSVMTEWIRCDERLPELVQDDIFSWLSASKSVPVFCADGVLRFACMRRFDDDEAAKWIQQGWDEYTLEGDCAPILWFPLPDPRPALTKGEPE